ncbi:MAG TPA: molecular chaperone HtpG, partial [Candidatus Binatia bacterium]|nr:molecular chaperone HtpG [Candidatus Binatia bacterium]
MATREATDSYRFQAEIKQLLNILVHSLYQDRDIFLRELISNASDALTQMHFQMLTDRNVHDAEAELAIRLQTEEKGDEKWLIVKDSGIGMTADELIQNLGTIAQSGARAFLERMQEGETSAGEIIGQFGVGFYSVFMVADLVRVVSRSYRPDAEASAWVSQGDDSFRIEPADKQDRGTEIQIKLKSDATEFASDWKLREVVKRHSDFVGYPIYLDGEQINQQQPLWRKSPPDVSQEDYNNFYKQMTMDFEEPVTVVHFHSDAPVHVRALLFVPASRDRGILAARKEPGLKLYSHNVLIQEYNKDLLPEWLSFVDGVVESEDLPLNVSRETVQSNRFMRQLGKTLRRRVTRALQDLTEEDGEKYAAFWKQHGRTVKEGLVANPASLQEVMPLLRYYSTKSEEDLTSLDQYLARMTEDQDAIYFVLGDSIHAASHSPHLDPFRVRDLEVLFWIDPLDAFLAPLVKEYKEKPIKNIDDAGLELPEDEDSVDEEDTLTEPELNRFIGRCVTTLGDRVVEVR